MRIKFLAVLLFACSLLCGCDRNSPNTGAPVATVAARQAWADKEFGQLWPHIKKWTANSELIAANIGEIQDVAPIGKPNQMFYSFGESWADMNLEVIGAKGKGTLSLSSASLSWKEDCGIHVWFYEGSFETAQRKEIICASGKGYLAEFKVDTLYNQLLTYPAGDDPDVFLDQWEVFEKLVISTFPKFQSPSGLSLIHI